MVMQKGTGPVGEAKIPDYDDMIKYNFFGDELFGLEEPLHDLMKFLKAGARRTETGKRILILVRPVSSGKSTIASMLKRGLEQDPTPIYAIKGCPMHEEPLHLIPRSQRPDWEEALGIKIELDPEYREKTTEYIFYLWNRPVHLETVVDGKREVFTCNGGTRSTIRRKGIGFKTTH